MLVGLACAVGASLCYGIGSVLQAIAAADTDSAAHLDPRLLLRLLKAWPYVLGLALDGAGFVLSLVALRSLPLYVVQAVVASFLAVTAVVGAVFLGTRVRMLEGVALAGVVLGLALVSLSAAPDSVRAPGKSVEWLVLAAGVALTLVAFPLGRLSGARGPGSWAAWPDWPSGWSQWRRAPCSSSAAPGDLVPPVHVCWWALRRRTPCWWPRRWPWRRTRRRCSAAAWSRRRRPWWWARRCCPRIVGLALLGDHARPGWGPAAAAGFILAVAAALLLSRFGEVSTARPGGGGPA